MTQIEVEIPEERVRQFALDGGLNEEAADHFLGQPCHLLRMVRIHALVLQEVLSEILSVGLVVGCQPAGDNCLDLTTWVPHDHSQRLVALIRGAYQKLEMECPYEFFDFDGLDSALPGRDYIQAMLRNHIRKHGYL